MTSPNLADCGKGHQGRQIWSLCDLVGDDFIGASNKSPRSPQDEKNPPLDEKEDVDSHGLSQHSLIDVEDGLITPIGMELTAVA